MYKKILRKMVKDLERVNTEICVSDDLVDEKNF